MSSLRLLARAVLPVLRTRTLYGTTTRFVPLFCAVCMCCVPWRRETPCDYANQPLARVLRPQAAVQDFILFCFMYLLRAVLPLFGRSAY